MARIRTIKPEFWVSPQIVECSTNARLLFIGLWNFCDDQGVHEVSPRQLKMEVFPGDDISADEVSRLIGELVLHGLVREIAVPHDTLNGLKPLAGKRFWHVTGWHHQKIDKPRSKHPDLSPLLGNSTNVRRTFDDDSTNVRSLRTDGRILPEPILPDGYDSNPFRDGTGRDGDLVSFGLEKIRGEARKLFAGLPMDTCPQDKELALKTAMLRLNGSLAEDGLQIALESAQKKNGQFKKTCAAFFMVCMTNQCKRHDQDFRQLLATTTLPKE